jgi:hypothetical protein
MDQLSLGVINTLPISSFLFVFYAGQEAAAIERS